MSRPWTPKPVEAWCIVTDSGQLAIDPGGAGIYGDKSEAEGNLVPGERVILVEVRPIRKGES